MDLTKKRKTETKNNKEVKDNKQNIAIYNLEGEIERKIEIEDFLIKTKINPKLIAQAIRVFLINQRQGTVSTKTRGEVKGSTRKIYRQKGTGRARHGDIKAPIFVGGGIVGGPKPKLYNLKLNKKQLKKALKDAFILKLKENKIFGLSKDFLKISPKTKTLLNFFKKINLSGKTLIVIEKIKNNNLFLSGKNLKDINFITLNSLNLYKLLNSVNIFFVDHCLESFLKKINEN